MNKKYGRVKYIIRDIVEWFFDTEEGQRCLLLGYPVSKIILNETCKHYHLGIYSIETFDNESFKETSEFIAEFTFECDLHLLEWEDIANYSSLFRPECFIIISDEMVENKNAKFFWRDGFQFCIDISKYQFKTVNGYLKLTNQGLEKFLKEEPNLFVTELDVLLSIYKDEFNCVYLTKIFDYLHFMCNKEKGISVVEDKYAGVLRTSSFLVHYKITFCNGTLKQYLDMLEKLVNSIDYAKYDTTILNYLKKITLNLCFSFNYSIEIESEMENNIAVNILKNYYKKVNISIR